ncbi:glycoside hydrolase family 114 protein, partial [Piromyces sp. E2]
LHKNGQKAICYFSGGSSERNKPDYNAFQKAGVISNVVSDWGNKLIDIRKIDKLKPLFRDRFRRAVKYGCDGVEVDSIGVPEEMIESITKSHTFNFAKMLAETAHNENISIGLKNCPHLAKDLVSYFDFAIVESCADYNECKKFSEFTKNKKAVFIVQY